MTVLTIQAENSEERNVKVAPNDFIAQIKSLCHGLFPHTIGKLLVLRHNGEELKDEKCVGDYKIKGTTGNVLELVVPERQPYSRVDYSKIVANLIKEGHRKDASFYFTPGDEWEGKWDKGDEYLSYPPVDVNNIWSSVAPSQSRELIGPSSPRPFGRGTVPNPDENSNSNDAASQKPRTSTMLRSERPRRNKFARTAANAYTVKQESTRSFHSLYCCNVNGFNFSVIHKLEGKWSGVAYFLGDKLQSTDKHACSSKLLYDNEEACWAEQQLFTNRDGLSTGRSFRYYPHAHGSLLAENEDPKMMDETLMRLQEHGNNILVLSAVNISTGQVIVTETITCSADFQSRVRVVQRFDSFGVLYGVFICKERKILDAETGALTPMNL